MSRLNGIARRQAAALGDVYVDVPVEAFEIGDFYNQGHFIAAGSTKFARVLAPAVAETCR
ncbi:MAG: hypothetical protein ACHQK9_01020 [Reyranellales bacterium]